MKYRYPRGTSTYPTEWGLGALLQVGGVRASDVKPPSRRIRGVPVGLPRRGHDGEKRPCRGQPRTGSLTGAVHLLKRSEGVPRRAQRGRKPRVEQKGKCWLDLSLQYGARSRNVGLSILFISEFEERGVRKITTGMATGQVCSRSAWLSVRVKHT